MTEQTDWRKFLGDGVVRPLEIKETPPWRKFTGPAVPRTLQREEIDFLYQIDAPEVDLVNAALYLRRPLLITGKPGVGKSTLIRAVAKELDLGKVLVWPINTRSTLEGGLWRYDAIARMQEANLPGARNEPETPEKLGRYIRLGPLGTAFLPSDRPRALLIDEIDKSDIDLPNDLLNLFEEGEFEIPVLKRSPHERVPIRADDGDDEIIIEDGRVRAREFPFIVMTSNGERDFPPPFLRRCIRLELREPDHAKLSRIIAVHLGDKAVVEAKTLIDDFLAARENASGLVATDQLLNAVFLASDVRIDLGAENMKSFRDKLFRPLR